MEIQTGIEIIIITGNLANTNSMIGRDTMYLGAGEMKKTATFKMLFVQTLYFM